jgi:hypothetical protein
LGGRFQEWRGAGFEEQFCGKLAKFYGSDLGAARLVVDADGLTGGWIRDYGEDLLPLAGFVLRSDATMDADGDLAASAECREGCAFGGDGVAGRVVVEKGDCGDGFGVVFTGFYAERALACCRTEIFWLEALADPFGLLEAIEPGGGEKNGVDLPLSQLAQAGVDVAAKFDGLDIGAKGEKLRATSLAAGAYDGSTGERAKAVVLDRNEDITRVNAGRSGTKRE